MTTFADVGIRFPLFAAEVGEAVSWEPNGICGICDDERPGFEIGIGDYVEVRCASCDGITPVPADGRPESCVACNSETQLEVNAEQTHGCWTCLRDGRWSSTKDTEAGMVTPIHAALGKTHGLPFPPGSQAQTAWDNVATNKPTLAGWPVGIANGDGWRAALIPSDVLVALVRSPNYTTWQGERWLFHCRRPMQYIGLWGRRDFMSHATDGDGRSFAVSAAQLDENAWEYLTNQGGDGAILTYMFECRSCGTHRGHWDVS